MFPLAHFLRQELRDAPGRASYTLRLTLSCAVLITLFMTLQIPFLAVALIVVFYVSQPNVLMIKLVSVVFFVTVTVALGGVLLIIILATLLATLSPYDPIAVETGQKFLPPSAQHLLGTDNFGRDTFTRLLYGGRVSLLVGFLSMLISIVFGTVYGIVSGSSGKLVDGFMMRIVDILMSVPSFLIIITLNIYMNAGIRTLVVTIGLFSWMGVARIVRAEVLSLRERDFILASEGLGARKSWVITRHFARNVFSPVLVASTNSIASAILTESSLSYLGFGISIPNPSWGGMLEGAQTYILTHPSLAVYPGVCILLTVLCFNVLGNGFRRRFSPNSGR